MKRYAAALPRGSTALAMSLALPLLMAGCALRPPPGPAPAPPVALPALAVPEGPTVAVRAYEQVQHAAAEAAAREGRWADAAWAWEIVLAISPQHSEAQRGRQTAQARVQAALAERLPLARATRARGQVDEASRLYLEVLAIEPGQLEAANAMRLMERDRARRQAIGGFARALAPADPTRYNEQARAAARPLDLEHASLLAGQGDVDAAIALLLPTPASKPADPATRKLLADLLLQRADKLSESDRPAAITTLRRALRWQPHHAQARARLQALLVDTSAANAVAPKKPAPREPASKPFSGPSSGR